MRELPAGNLAVVGVSVADEQGSQTDIDPILDTTITLHGSSMRADLAFEELSRELQAKAGRTVGVATTGKLFRQSQLELPDGKMSARTALIQLISQLRVEFHWRAFYDAGMQMYFVNLVPTLRNRDLIRKDEVPEPRPRSGPAVRAKAQCILEAFVRSANSLLAFSW